MKRTILLSVVLGLTLLMLTTARANPVITVDGSLTDWGVTPGTNYTPLAGVNSFIEPSVGANGYVGPGYGGQDFNVEAMYSTISNNKLYFAVVTGLPPTGASGWNGHANEQYYPGDILIDFAPYYTPSSSTTPTGTFDFAVETTTYGPNYPHGGIGAQGAGAVFSNVTPGLAELQWDGVYAPYEIARDGSHVAQGTLVNTDSQLVYSHWGGDHYVIEGYVSLDAFAGQGNGGNFNGVLSWTMGCANDQGSVCQTVEGREVPEPASLLLLASGAVALIRKRKR